MIPLELSTIPTKVSVCAPVRARQQPKLCSAAARQKEFREKVSSLSPEMQNFAKAWRSMQLASTLFGVLVIQVRPALERVLNLPDDSLTREIKLTQV